MEHITPSPDNPAAAWLLLSEAFRYPGPGLLAALAGGAAALPSGSTRELFAAFLREIGGLSLGEWEELYTRTFDLDPRVAPYIGYHIWGDGYRRGEFMAALSAALAEAGVPAAGELPDHLAPVLCYLGSTAPPWPGQRPAPLPELVSVLEPALERMAEALCKAEPDNPYARLIAAVQALCRHSLPKEAA